MLNLFKQIDVVVLSPDAEHYIVKFPPDEVKKERLKLAVPGAKWDSQDKCFYVPATWDNTRALIVHGFANLSKETKEHARRVRDREANNVVASRCADAALDIPTSFGVVPFPFQRAGIKYALERKRVIIGDQMGLGKTIQGLATVHMADAFPLVVVTPSSLKYNWAETEIPRALRGKHVVVADKHTPALLLQIADVIVTNYEQLVGIRTYMGQKTVDRINPETNQIEHVTIKVKKQTSWKDQTKREVILSPLAEKLQRLQIKSIICDEAHYLKEPTTARTCATMAIRHSAKYRLLLTGTAMLNKPAELFSLLKFLDRADEFGGWMNFMTRYCGLKKGKWGPEAKSAFNSAELNRKLRASCYIRRLKADVLKELPPKLRTCYSVELDNQAEYDRAEEELIEWVKDRVHQDKEFMQSIEHLGPEERLAAISAKQQDKAERAARAEQVVRISALKNISARGKLSFAKQWIDDFLLSGEKLVVFATGKEVINWLLSKYSKAARIVSEDDAHERQRNVQRFQNEADTSLIICAMGTSATNSPGGVGHTLTAGNNVLFVELGWNPALHDQCEDRCHRIGQKDNVTAHYLLGRGTIDLDIAELIESKRVISKQVLDGGIVEEEPSIMHELVDRLVKKNERANKSA